MPQQNQYSEAHKERKKSGAAKSWVEGAEAPPPGAKPADIMPSVPPKPEQPQLPVDDLYRKYRTQQG